MGKLKTAHMSSDERDEEMRTFRVVRPEWQSAQFRRFMHQLDDLYIREFKRMNKGGNAPRVRIQQLDGPQEAGSAPVGLWRNCYDSVWLASLQASQRNRLRIIDEDYPFPPSDAQL